MTLPPPHADDLLMTAAQYPVADTPRDDEAATPGPRPVKRRPPVLAVAVIAIVPLLVLVLYEVLITGFMYDQRQQHLAANFSQPRPKTADGQAYGVLQIPTVGLNQILIEGDSTTNMRGAPAHRPGSTQPGQVGTVVVLGHHSRFGGPFGSLAQVGADDSIFLQAKNGAVIEYRVVCNIVVDSGPSPYLVPGDDARLVLVTASGGLFSGKRRIVIATTTPTAPTPSAPSTTSPVTTPTTTPTTVAATTTSTPASQASGPSSCPSPPPADPSRPLPSLEPDRGSLVVNRDALLFYIGITVTIAVGRYLWRRYRPMTCALVLVPFVAFTSAMALGLLDRVLPGTL